MLANIRRKSFQVVMMVALAATPCISQQLNVGGITGTVRDPSGAVVPRAAVSVEHLGTGLKQSVHTSDEGIYVIKLLPLGKYNVSVTKEGFATAVAKDIPVLAGQNTTVDIGLSVGAVTQTLTVEGEAPILDTTTTTSGINRGAKELKDLPIFMPGQGARSAVYLVRSMPGVSYITSDGTAWQTVSRGIINGVPAGQFGYEIDGLPSSVGVGDTAEDRIAPSPEQIVEVRLASNAESDLGFNGGVSIAMVSRSGTNNLHGSFYWYNRNDALEARNFFAGSVIPQDNHNQIGFSVGGPVVIPKVYNGKGKTFFFSNMDTFRQRGAMVLTGGATLGTVPTAAMRQGDFREFLGPQIGTDALGRPILQGEIYDPATTRPDGLGGIIRDPFMFNGQLNVIDPARFSAFSSEIQPHYSLPTTAGTQLNWQGLPYQSILLKDVWANKIDHVISSAHRFSFALDHGVPWFLPDQLKGTGGSYSQSYLGNGYLSPSISDGFVALSSASRWRINYVWMAKPNLLFNFRAGITRDPGRGVDPAKGTQLSGASSASPFGSPITPQVAVDGISGFGCNFCFLRVSNQRLPAFADVTWTKGNHLFKFGGQYLQLASKADEGSGNNGSFSFLRLETSLPGQPVDTGVGYASFLLGEVDRASYTTTRSQRVVSWTNAVFLADTWRVTQKLTINYGIRWEVTTPMHELYDRLSTFDPSLPNPGAGGILGALSIYGVGSGRNGLSNVSDYYNKAFAPRFGLAYAFNPKTVFRASYGLAYLPYIHKWVGQSSRASADGFSVVRTAQSLDNGVTPAYNWDDPFPIGFPPLPVIDPTLNNGGAITFIDRGDKRPPYIQNIGVEVGREVWGGVNVRVGYVGSVGHRHYGPYNLNQLPISALSLGPLLLKDINSPEAQAAGIPLPFPGFTGSVAQALRPYPQYTTITNLMAQTGNSTYHSLQINVQKNVGDFSFMSNFTWAKYLTNADVQTCCGASNLKTQHPDLRSTAKTLGGYFGGNAGDRARIFNLSWVWDVPLGSGKRYLGSAKGALNQVVGGWQVSGIQTYQTGTPFQVSSAASIPGMGPIWPVRVPGVPIKLRGCGDVDPGDPVGRFYLNVAAFQTAAPFTFGNMLVPPDVRQCGFLNEDLSISKAFPVTDRFRIQLGSVFGNVFNRVNFVNPSGNIAFPTSFGRYTTAAPARTVQLYLRLEY